MPYKKIQWTNDFYTDLAKNVKGHTSPAVFRDHFLTRKMTKQTMMYILYKPFDSNRFPPFYYAFKKLFPDETKLMEIIKKAGRSMFPKILQSVEAKVMLTYVCGAFGEKHPDVPFLTVHDCVLVGDVNITKIECVAEEVLERYIGATPGLKLMNLDANKTLDDITEVMHDEWPNMLEKIGGAKKNPMIAMDAPKFNIAPLLYEKPKHKGKILFSSRYYIH